MQTDRNSITVIESKSAWSLFDLKELFSYRDVFFFLIWRDIKVLYAQTILGFLWAILQPLITITLFTIVFGTVAKVPSDGVPYVLFSTVAIIPWTYMSQSMSNSSQSLVAGQNLLGKIYFPRLLFPLTSIFANLVDFSISMLIFIAVSLYYHVIPTWNLLFLPLFCILMICISASVGIGFSAMAIRFRDVKYAMPFSLRMLMYTAPIVYSASAIPEKYRLWYSFNPIVSVIEGFRACLLGTPFPWQYIWPGTLVTLILLLVGLYYFKRMEQIFVDVI